MIVGVDIGGHHIAAALVAGSPLRLVPDSYRHAEVASDADADTLISRWAETIETVIALAPEEVGGVGIAMPGPFDYRSGIAYFQGANAKFQALYDFDVLAALTAAMQRPRPIRFLNDATAFGVGCVGMGFAPTEGRVLGVTLGTGLGGAFLEDGVPVVADPRVPPCGCLWDLPFLDGIADNYVSARWLLHTARARSGTPFADVAAAAAAARDGDASAEAVFADYGANLGSVIAPWVKRFDAGTIMLGGRITRAYDLFGPTLAEVLSNAGLAPTLAVHEDTEDAAIAGGAMTFNPAFWERARDRLPAR